MTSEEISTTQAFFRIKLPTTYPPFRAHWKSRFFSPPYCGSKTFPIRSNYTCKRTDKLWPQKQLEIQS